MPSSFGGPNIIDKLEGEPCRLEILVHCMGVVLNAFVSDARAHMMAIGRPRDLIMVSVERTASAIETVGSQTSQWRKEKMECGGCVLW